jgi:hypothetical protein
MSQGVIGYKSRALRGANELPEVTKISPADPQFDEAEFTHLQSPNRTKEFKATFRNPGEVTLECNFIPGNAIQQAIEDDFLAGVVAPESWTHKICDETTGAPLRTYTYSAYIKSAKTSEISTTEPIKFIIVLRVTGATAAV